MASQGPLSPGTMADDSAVGSAAWADVNNAKVSDNIYATTGTIDAATSHYLKATNFGFSIPVGATIDGILVEIERHMDGSDITDSRVSIVKSDGVVGTTNKASAVGWVTTLNTYYSYGTASDLWGETWSPADINDADFGVVLSVSSVINFSDAFVDHIRITVHYTEAPTTSTSSTSASTSISTSSTSTSISTSFSTSISVSTSTTTVITMPVPGNIRPLGHRYTMYDTIPRSPLRVRR